MEMPRAGFCHTYTTLNISRWKIVSGIICRQIITSKRYIVRQLCAWWVVWVGTLPVGYRYEYIAPIITDSRPNLQNLVYNFISAAAKFNGSTFDGLWGGTNSDWHLARIFKGTQPARFALGFEKDVRILGQWTLFRCRYVTIALSSSCHLPST